MGDEKRKSGGKGIVFFLGILFTVGVVGAAAWYVPFLDCPGCEVPTEAEPALGEVCHPENCIHCNGSSALTVAGYLAEFPVEVRKDLPKLPENLPIPGGSGDGEKEE